MMFHSKFNFFYDLRIKMSWWAFFGLGRYFNLAPLKLYEIMCNLMWTKYTYFSSFIAESAHKKREKKEQTEKEKNKYEELTKPARQNCMNHNLLIRLMLQKLAAAIPDIIIKKLGSSHNEYLLLFLVNDKKLTFW